MRRATRAFFQRALLSYPNFNPRSPWGERPVVYKLSDSCCSISIHALREESDPSRNSTGALHFNFNPRSPWGERPAISCSKSLPIVFQSTLSVRRATVDAGFFKDKPANFNPRSPWGERPAISCSKSLPIVFQSTLSVRRATVDAGFFKDKPANFNPRSPWGERQPLGAYAIRSLDFNPRSPWGERLNDLSNRNTDVDISIHALREESDKCYNTNVPVSNKFQSTLSVRRATPLSVNILVGYWFQSTLSVRRATSVLNTCKQSLFISIHALREESDQVAVCVDLAYNWFQSTLSVRRATQLTILQYFCCHISIHALREESDKLSLFELSPVEIFQSTLSVRRATCRK